MPSGPRSTRSWWSTPSRGPSTRPTRSGSPASSATPAAPRCCGGPRAERARGRGWAPGERARAVIVAANRDDAAVLITLTVPQLNPTFPITTSVREEENANLLRQSGANPVITTSATSGRLLGLSTDAPRVVDVVEDLVTGGQGLDLHQRTASSSEVGLDPRSLRDIVLSVTRGGRSLRFDDPLIGTLQPEDVLVVVRSH